MGGGWAALQQYGTAEVPKRRVSRGMVGGGGGVRWRASVGRGSIFRISIGQ